MRLQFGQNHCYVIKGSNGDQVTAKGREIFAQHPGTYMQMSFDNTDPNVNLYQFYDQFDELLSPFTPEAIREEARRQEEADGRKHIIDLDA